MGNEELHNLYRSPDIVRMIKSRRFKYADLVAIMEEVMSALRIVTSKTRRNRPLGRPRHRWEYNIIKDPK